MAEFLPGCYCQCLDPLYCGCSYRTQIFINRVLSFIFFLLVVYYFYLLVHGYGPGGAFVAVFDGIGDFFRYIFRGPKKLWPF